MGRWFTTNSTVDAVHVTALFPPQCRDWGLPAEVPLTPHAAERLSRESAQKAFDEAAKSLNIDFKTEWDGKQIQRWSERLGDAMVRERDHQTQALSEGRHPEGPLNAPQLLVIGVNGGRWQGREKDADSGSRWRKKKVLAPPPTSPATATMAPTPASPNRWSRHTWRRRTMRTLLDRWRVWKPRNAAIARPRWCWEWETAAIGSTRYSTGNSA